MPILSATIVERAIEQLNSDEPKASIAQRLNQLLDSVQRDELPPEESSPPSHGRVRGRSYYDAIIDEMLQVVRVAGTREQLIEVVTRKLSGSVDHQVALAYVIIEGTLTPGGTNLTQVKIADVVGAHPSRAKNAIAQFNSDDLTDSPLLRTLLVEAESIDFLQSELARSFLYFGEFDSLFGRSRGAWISAVALPAIDARKPARAIVALYPVSGVEERPSLPRGAAQEWRVFEFLRVGYELLNHQLESVAEQVRSQRRELLADLAPGIVNHEMNQHLRVLVDAADVMNIQLRKLPSAALDSPPMGHIVEALSRQYEIMHRLINIADAFNNLDKRTVGEAVSLRVVVEEAFSLLQYRFNHAGIETELMGLDDDPTIETDAPLIEHVLINILTNALDAFESCSPCDDQAETREFPSRLIRVSLTMANETLMELTISNNGPAIPLHDRDRIFAKGVTTKGHGIGHGLGLYICRLVMTFLGGSIVVEPPEQTLEDFTVAFRLTFPRGTSPILADEHADDHFRLRRATIRRRR